jgi:hypothetical protein
MKLYYRFWMAFGSILPFDRDGKLIFEPYKGFMSDLHDLKYAENETKHGRQLITNVQEIEYRIVHNTVKWEHGDRW